MLPEISKQQAAYWMERLKRFMPMEDFADFWLSLSSYLTRLLGEHAGGDESKLKAFRASYLLDEILVHIILPCNSGNIDKFKEGVDFFLEYEPEVISKSMGVWLTAYGNDYDNGYPPVDRFEYDTKGFLFINEISRMLTKVAEDGEKQNAE